MSFVCLAVTMVLFISLFLYFRQKIIALEEKLALLSDLTTTMAGITTLQRPTVCKQVEAAESEETSPRKTRGRTKKVPRCRTPAARTNPFP